MIFVTVAVNNRLSCCSEYKIVYVEKLEWCQTNKENYSICYQHSCHLVSYLVRVRLAPFHFIFQNNAIAETSNDFRLKYGINRKRDNVGNKLHKDPNLNINIFHGETGIMNMFIAFPAFSFSFCWPNKAHPRN